MDYQGYSQIQSIDVHPSICPSIINWCATMVPIQKKRNLPHKKKLSIEDNILIALLVTRNTIPFHYSSLLTLQIFLKFLLILFFTFVCFKDAHCNNCWIVIPILFKMCLNMVYTGLCVIMHTIDECVLCLDTSIEIQDKFYFSSVLKIYCVTSTNF